MNHKYIEEIMDIEESPYGWSKNTGRDEMWADQRKEYGFDERETWSLDTTFIYWLYERLRMFNEVNCINTEFHTFEINGKKLTQQECIDIISKLRFNNDSNLFALERNEGLKAILGAIYQSFDGKDVYPSIQEKAANFFYMIIKNHVFIDGNKRIAATLFIYFLDYYKILYKDEKQIIDNNTLVALTLLIAQSNPKEKEILIDLIMNFLVN